MMALAAGIRGDLDLITLKTESRAHQSRLGEARLFRVKCTGEPSERRAQFARAVGRQLDAEAYDIVHVRGPFEGVMVADLRGPDTKLIYEVATFADEAEGPLAEEEWEASHVRCLEAADLVLVGAEAAARALGERGYAGKVAVVGPGVDVDSFDWWPRAPAAETRIVYLGSFAADREIVTLLSALRAASQRVPLQALIAGDPDPERRQEVRRLVDAFDLSEFVDVQGDPRPVALPSIIAAADLAVVTASATPRFRELGDLPQPLLEYLACRRAVIAAGVPAVAEIVRDEREGLLYPPGDESSLADAIVALATDPDLRDSLVARAYERTRRVFSLAARRRRIAEVYEMLASGSQSYDAWAEGFDDEVPWAPISSLVDVVPEVLPEQATPIDAVSIEADATMEFDAVPLEGTDTNANA